MILKGKKNPENIYIDCTESFFSGLNTGIQRVVNEISLRSQILSQSIGIPCVPIIGVGGKYYRLEDAQKIRGAFSEKLKNFKCLLKDSYYWFKSRSVRKSKKVYYDQSFPILDRSSWYFLLKVEYFFKNIVRLLVSTVQLQIMHFRIRTAVKPISIKSNDLLLIPDGFTGRYYDFTALKKAFKLNVTIIPLLHDIIPITHPEVAHERGAKIFRKTLDQMLSYSSGVMTVSRSVKENVEKYLAHSSISSRFFPVRFFYLGADFSREKKYRPHKKRSFEGIISSVIQKKFFLIVGTIEPRKGHMIALKAFNSLWEENFDSVLVLVGRIGWKCEIILREIERSPFQGEKLIFLPNLEDWELSQLYENATGLILPSVTEGFGLPMVEAMHFGIPVIASDIPVFREIGGDYPIYFDWASSDDLVRKLKLFDQDPSLRKSEVKKWITWDESALKYIEESLVIFRETHSQRDLQGNM
ncbi:glycosyltransferase family 4 protein [Leptospirillum ferriphilum]|uniref:Putative glycosyltransferase n=1 Tax=Leptospirillum ferriphilum (strain ML-04) TaxID=1048260 RepID=J9ZEC2_LEPFM|nr:glycosyltransferase family 1 protein [Leptospirillum ferriphilum]AFS53997.1 putative glycosyltransferase [Leptospirillum ferriphilum ML-04]